MIVIGVNQSGYTSSAVLLQDGKVIAACSEERLNRQKFSRDFPTKSIQFCLKQAGKKIGDVDYFATAWNPAISVMKLRKAYSGAARYRGEYFYSVPSNLAQFYQDKNSIRSEQDIVFQNHKIKTIFVNHHDAHASHAFFLSPFRDAAILTVDGFGEKTTTQISHGRGNKIDVLKSVDFPQSIGLLYATFTQLMGYEPDSDEWKVMGAAPYGNAEKYLSKFRKVVTTDSEGNFEMDLTYFNYYNFDHGYYYNDKLVSLFGAPRKKDEELTQKHYDMAAGLQRITEEILFKILKQAHKLTKSSNVCLAGGVIMNSVFNGKVLSNSPFKKIYIPSSAEDCGTCMGAALYAYRHVLDGKNRFELEHDYWGPEWSEAHIEAALKKYNLRYQKRSDIETVTAKLIAEGKTIGRLSGRMEFGQRALGNRSILADPRREDMKHRVNAIIKYRELYRPFAPSILEEDARDYFELDPGVSVPFMEKVYPIKKSKRKLIPAVTHVDGSGRLQTVSKKTNPKYHKLISEFKKLTGVPVVLNTSFNLQGEPIVCAPEDAIRTFFTSGLDHLTLENFLVSKS